MSEPIPGRIQPGLTILDAVKFPAPPGLNRAVAVDRAGTPVWFNQPLFASIDTRQLRNGLITPFPVDTDTTPPVITITSPGEGTLFSQSPIEVTGALDDDTATVTVNGVSAAVAGGQWSASVPLQEGANILSAVAVDPAGNTDLVSIQVVLDSGAPVIAITSPAARRHAWQSRNGSRLSLLR